MANTSKNICEHETCSHKNESCGCGTKNCMGCLGGHHVIRYALGIFLLWLVFIFGMQIGEIKNELGSSKGYGHRGSMMYSSRNNMQGQGMMGSYLIETNAQPAVVAPQATTSPATKK